MDTITREIVLVTGIKCVVGELFGKHQKILSTKNNLLTGKGVNTVLADCIKSIGSDGNITEEKVRNMLSADRKKCLVEIRSLSLDYDPTFRFDYEWEDADKVRTKFSYEVDFTSDQFTEETYKTSKDVPNPDNEEETIKQLTAIQVNELSELEEFKTVEITLPRSKQRVKFNLLDGKGEETAASIPASKRTSHTPLEVRNPKVFFNMTADDKELWGKLDLDRLSFQDITYLRSRVNELEGSIDSTLIIQHQVETHREVKLDVLTIPTFFFPSGSMQ